MPFETFGQQSGEQKTGKIHFIPEMLPGEDGVMKLSREQLLELSSEDLEKTMKENEIKGVQFSGIANFMTPNEILVLKKKMENPPDLTH